MPRNVLVVDDDRDLVKAISLRLRSVGIGSVEAYDAVSATQIARSAKPDLILLDIGLPGADGHTVGMRIRMDPMTWEIPMIFITGRDSLEDRIKASGVGAFGYLLKPFKPQELLFMVSMALADAPGTN